ncbi:platelet endothelial cell adhesion molecule isoform X2 [Sceloporus undulatus]|uniref:platelet endothelial cell adhesion molecule isoform X2 n=1 Tax=Sceloporus undulatus TaxID=8520 RepID=UPI001C4CBB04|nr:platelet endothelial cell adhesion molecule isoform X2 [Sceloporus undulatus]
MYCVLLLILLQCCKLKAQDGVFTIQKVTLWANPPDQVQNGKPLTLNCSADVIKSEHFRLSYIFSFFKYNKVLFNSTSEQAWAQYTIPKARFSDSGEYDCTLRAEGKIKSSDPVTVKVKGITKPKLTVQKEQVMEGEKVSLRCEIPEEKPPFYFTFYKIQQSAVPHIKNRTQGPVNENFADFEFPIEAGDKILRFECTVRMNSVTGQEMSEPSNRTIVTVVEPFTNPIITIHPPQNITEGDKIDIECTTVLGSQGQTEILIQKNRTILNSTKGKEKVTYSKIATMEDNDNYTCKAELGSVSKTSVANVVVTELFSRPELIVQKPNLDEASLLVVQCQVNGPQSIDIFLLKNNKVLRNSSTYMHRAQVSDSGAYLCRAEVKGIVKESDPVLVRVYAPVSKPVLSQPVSQVAVLGKYFILYCNSSQGTPPIIYTLYRGNVSVKNKTVEAKNKAAKFEVQAMGMHPLEEYSCHAQNGHSRTEKSTGLNITVIAPVGNVSLGRLPEGDVEDGQELTLLCSVSSGSFPIEFRFFREDNAKSLHWVTEGKKHRAFWHRTGITSQDTGRYFCRADNQAKSFVESKKIAVNVVLASWKKWLVVTVMLILTGIAIGAFWWFCSKKAKAKGNSLELASSMPATNSVGEKLTSGQNNEREFFYAPVAKKNETVYTEIRKAVNDAEENRHSRIEDSPDGT